MLIILTSASFELSISCNSTHFWFASFNAFDRSSVNKNKLTDLKLDALSFQISCHLSARSVDKTDPYIDSR